MKWGGRDWRLYRYRWGRKTLLMSLRAINEEVLFWSKAQEIPIWYSDINRVRWVRIGSIFVCLFFSTVYRSKDGSGYSFSRLLSVDMGYLFELTRSHEDWTTFPDPHWKASSLSDSIHPTNFAYASFYKLTSFHTLRGLVRKLMWFSRKWRSLSKVPTSFFMD